ncbi:MAG: ABC-F family ATP-binding cassette domain-containing protein, partial [Lachnospiraceae bacterium]|nr:ABC-F family ATP-binding cassette domain-containing protein [Lachnospiraceae bacterium]
KSMGRRFEREDRDMTEFPETEEAIFFKLGTEKSRMPQGKTVIEYSLEKLYAGSGAETETKENGSASQAENLPEQGKLLSRAVFLRVRGPEKVCMVGDNGCGKTTLLRKIVESMEERTDLRYEYMPQNYEDLLDFSRTPVDILDRSGSKEERTRIRTYLGAMKFTAEEMDHPAGELSGGQKAKLFLLKMSMSDANLLILDEPTRNFSPLSGPVIRALLRAFPGAIIAVSHDRKFIREVCTRVLKLTPEGLVPYEDGTEKDSIKEG